MPVIGEVSGLRVITFGLDGTGAQAIRDLARTTPQAVTVPCCGHRAFIRRSPLGLWHFVHRETTGCDYIGDAAEVMLLKWHAHDLARERGLQVELEVRGGGFFCDVLYTSPTWRIALQLFRSGRRLARCEDEQTALWSARIRGAWFVRSLPKRHVEAQALPMFRVDPAWEPRTLDPPTVSVGHSVVPFRAFVMDLLDRRVRFLEHQVVRERYHLAIIAVPMLCPSCGEDYIVCPLPVWQPATVADATGRSSVQLEEAVPIALSGRDLGGRRVATLQFYPAGPRWKCPVCRAEVHTRQVVSGLRQEIASPPAPGILPYAFAFEVLGPASLVRAPHWCVQDEDGGYRDAVPRIGEPNRPVLTAVPCDGAELCGAVAGDGVGVGEAGAWRLPVRA